MGLRIKTNVNAEKVMQSLGKSSRETAASIEKLSSGQGINKGADDPAGLAIGTKMNHDIQSFHQANKNANMGISLVQVTEGGLNEVSSMLTRLKEISAQSASDVLSESDRQNIEIEYQELVSEIDRISDTSTFNGLNLLNGENEESDLRFQVGIDAEDHSAVNYSLDDINSKTDNIGIDGTSVASRDDALDSMDSIDQAQGMVSTMRAQLGSTQKRLQSSVNNIETTIVSLEGAKSQIMDADIAKESSNLAKNNILKSAGVSLLAQTNYDSNAALKLIG
jgi:flagellin